MTKTETKTGSAAARGMEGGHKGIASAAGAIGRAIGFIRRIGTRRLRGRKDEGEQDPARRRRAVLRDALEVEIARLEGKLDEIYGRIVQGAGSLKREEIASEALDLQSMIELTREVKIQLREKRAELSRIKRDEARWSQLGQTGWREGDPAAQKGRAASRSGPPGQKLRKAITRASSRSSFQDDAQKVIFDRVVDDLLEDDAEIRRTAAARLGELGSPSAFDILVATLDDPHDRVRVAALNSLALIGDSSAARLFERFTGDADHRLRIAALRGLSRMEGEEADLSLINGLEDEHPSVRKAAATYLGWRRERTAVRALARALRDDEEDVRAAAAASLGSIRDDKAVLSLMRALVDPARTVREKAVASLGATLGRDLEIDLQAGDEAVERRVEELKSWWKEARVGDYFERARGPTVPEEPTAAAAQVEEAPPQEPGGALEARDGTNGTTPGPQEPRAAEAPGHSRAEAGFDDGFGGPDGLEGLGVSVATTDSDAPDRDGGEKE